MGDRGESASSMSKIVQASSLVARRIPSSAAIARPITTVNIKRERIIDSKQKTKKGLLVAQTIKDAHAEHPNQKRNEKEIRFSEQI